MLKLTEQLRSSLKEPFGEVLSGNALLERVEGRRLVVVGDNSLAFLLENGIRPDVAVYDFRCMRQDVGEGMKKAIEEGVRGMRRLAARNPAGTITDEMLEAVKKAVAEGGTAVFIDGEEDMAALVAMMFAGDGALILYGQPHEGVVVVEGSEKTREAAKGIMEKMEKAES